MTKDQFQARLLENLYDVKYKCLDDFKDMLGPHLGQGGMTEDELQRLYGTVKTQDGKKVVPLKFLLRDLK